MKLRLLGPDAILTMESFWAILSPKTPYHRRASLMRDLPGVSNTNLSPKP